MPNQQRPSSAGRTPDAHFGRLPQCCVFAIVALAMLSSCASERGGAGASPPLTLASTPQLPASEIAQFYPPAQWQKLRTMPYAAYVVVSGEVFNTRFRVEHVVQSYPDHRYNAVASELLQRVTLKAWTVGTHITPAVSAWIILYPKELDGALALIYARQANYDGPPDRPPPQFFRAQFY